MYPLEPFGSTMRLRGVSSAGRAPALQAGGHRFDPGTLHRLNQLVEGRPKVPTRFLLQITGLSWVGFQLGRHNRSENAARCSAFARASAARL